MFAKKYFFWFFTNGSKHITIFFVKIITKCFIQVEGLFTFNGSLKPCVGWRNYSLSPTVGDPHLNKNSNIFIFSPFFRFCKTEIQFIFLTKISMFEQLFHLFDFRPKFIFLTKIYIFDQNLYFLPKFIFLTKIYIFDQNLYF